MPSQAPRSTPPTGVDFPARSGVVAPYLIDPGRADGARRLDSTAPLLAGRYRVVDLLGEGGMSTVYGAYDTRLERPVAIKVLHLALGAPSSVLVREARVLAGVRHPNVVTVHSVHDDADPPFLVMERLEGRSLDEVVRDRRPSLREALEYLRQIAAGLDAIHAAGLIHGDVKPSNVIVDADGHLCIVDVGLVPMLERMKDGEILGTPSYMPPERALGAALSRELAPLGDVYSFAVLAFELLTGQRPFDREPQAALVYAHALVPAPRPSQVSALARGFDAPFARALSKTPLDRPASAGLFVDLLERVALGVDARGVALRILVVDDDGDMRSMLSSALAVQLRGAIIETASDGALALESIRRNLPSIAILDLWMPGIAGADLVRAALAVAPRLPIIVCTGHGSGPAWKELKQLGVRSFFIKPFEVDQLVRAIREVTLSPDWRSSTDPGTRARPSG